MMLPWRGWKLSTDICQHWQRHIRYNRRILLHKSHPLLRNNLPITSHIHLFKGIRHNLLQCLIIQMHIRVIRHNGDQKPFQFRRLDRTGLIYIIYTKRKLCLFLQWGIRMKHTQRHDKFTKINNVIILDIKQLEHPIHKQIIPVTLEQCPSKFILVYQSIMMELITQLPIQFPQRIHFRHTKIGLRCNCTTSHTTHRSCTLDTTMVSMLLGRRGRRTSSTISFVQLCCILRLGSAASTKNTTHCMLMYASPCFYSCNKWRFLGRKRVPQIYISPALCSFDD
mmetsp:Transcript_9292/g.18463  ORF Transcript_9292/g.18463 Transcript_9292/m.18463 type:complete len:281 (-) Transcript_9292:61-903(-)